MRPHGIQPQVHQSKEEIKLQTYHTRGTMERSAAGCPLVPLDLNSSKLSCVSEEQERAFLVSSCQSLMLPETDASQASFSSSLTEGSQVRDQECLFHTIVKVRCHHCIKSTRHVVSLCQRYLWLQLIRGRSFQNRVNPTQQDSKLKSSSPQSSVHTSLLFFFLLILWHEGSNPGLCTHQTGILPLTYTPSPFYFYLETGPKLLRLALNL